MHIKFRREYDIEFDGTAREFIMMVDRKLKHDNDSGLDSLDMGDAVAAACQLFDQGDLTEFIDISDHTYNYIDCPDSRTVLDGDYKVMYGSDAPGFKSPAELEHAAKQKFNCCEHCLDGNRCPEYPNNHIMPCVDGC